MPLWFFVGRGCSAEVFQAGLEIFHERLRLLGALALRLHDSLRRAGDEGLVRVLALEHGDLLQAVGLFLFEAALIMM